MSLLTIIQDTCDLLSLPRPSSVVSSADLQVRQLFQLSIEECNELVSKLDWQALTRQQTFVTTATAAQDAAIPDDLKKFIPNSFFNRTTRRPVLGPITPQLWQNIQANPQINRVVLAFRKRDGAFLVTPDPPAGQTIGYEYISNNWARNAAETESYVRWQADTDTTYLDENLIKLGIRWRWRKTKGLPYGEDFDTYTSRRDELMAQDQGAGQISQTGISNIDYVGNPNIPETGFGSG